MHKRVLFLALFVLPFLVKAQHWALYNTGTLYDSFENPSQKTFTPDSSRRIAFNCFIPNGGMSYAGRGPAEATIRQLFYLGPLDPKGLDNNDLTYNKLFADGNIYVAMLRVFKSIEYNREWGLSWQVKAEGDLAITNQTFTTFHNPTITEDINFNDNLNNFGKGQLYHQLSFTYRENYNRRLAFGGKISYLSGIGYSKLKIDHSRVNVNSETETFDVYFKGSYQSNFLHNNFSKRLLIPFFDNPGMAVSASFNYKTLRGLNIMGTIKDLGFILWRRTPYRYEIDGEATVDASEQKTIANQLQHYIERDILQDPVTEKFSSSTNGKAELLFSKIYGSFQPNLILSKSLIAKTGNVVLVNNYNYKWFKASLTTGYDFRKVIDIGGQLMYKTPNVEFFLGSDRLFKSLMIVKGVSSMQADLADKKQNETPPGSGYSGASAYLGFSLKFGKILYRWQNTSSVPGLKMPKMKKPKKK